jgi:hypothetical protein
MEGVKMAKKPVPAVTKKPAAPVAKAAPVVSTPVRNSPVPKTAGKPIAKKDITYAEIAKRAYEIHCSGTGGSETDNWYRAERELRGQ